MKLEEKAQQFATEIHKGQFRKDNKTPYITHPEAVVRLLKGVKIKDEDIICSAWLHDTIEDCEISSAQIKREFNVNIERIVKSLTRDVGRDKYKERIKNADYAVQIIKLADTVHNCSELYSYLSRWSITTKIKDCKELYFDLAKEICSEFYALLKKYTNKWMINGS